MSAGVVFALEDLQLIIICSNTTKSQVTGGGFDFVQTENYVK